MYTRGQELGLEGGVIIAFCPPQPSPVFFKGSRQRSCVLSEETNPTETLDAREREHDWTPSNLMQNKVQPCGSKILIWAMRQQKAAEEIPETTRTMAGSGGPSWLNIQTWHFQLHNLCLLDPLHGDPPKDRSFTGYINRFLSPLT